MPTTNNRSDVIRSAPQPQCIACASRGITLYTGLVDRVSGAPGEWRMARCPDPRCGMLWLDPAPLPEDLIKAYAAYHTHGRKHARGAAQLALSALNSACKMASRAQELGSGLGRQRRGLHKMFLGDLPPGALLEVGSGAGRFLERMRRTGWSVRGTDFDPAVAERIRSRYGIAIDVGDLRSLAYPSESYDAVAMSQVLEHVPEPVALLAECRRVLRPGGRLVLSTPNARALAHRRFGRAWRGLEPPRHLHLFTREALSRSAERAGLHVSRLMTLSAESAGIYRASEEIQDAESGGPSGSAAARILRSWLLRYREYRASLQDVDAGQDLFLIATR